MRCPSCSTYEHPQRPLTEIGTPHAVQAAGASAWTTGPGWPACRVRAQSVYRDYLQHLAARLGTQLEVRVFKAFEVRDELKRLGFRFDGSTKAWSKVFPSEGFAWEQLRSAAWRRGSVGVEVRNEAGEIVHSDADPTRDGTR